MPSSSNSRKQKVSVSAPKSYACCLVRLVNATTQYNNDMISTPDSSAVRVTGGSKVCIAGDGEGLARSVRSAYPELKVHYFGTPLNAAGKGGNNT